MRWFFDTAGVGCDYRTAPVEPSVVPAAKERGRRKDVLMGELHVTKECSEYTGKAGDHCSIVGSDLEAIVVGSKVVYAEEASGGTLDTDVALNAGAGNTAVGHVVLDLSAGTGVVTFAGGTWHPCRIHRQGRRFGRPDRSLALGRNLRFRHSRFEGGGRRLRLTFSGTSMHCDDQAVMLARCSGSWSMARRSRPGDIEAAIRLVGPVPFPAGLVEGPDSGDRLGPPPCEHRQDLEQRRVIEAGGEPRLGPGPVRVLLPWRPGSGAPDGPPARPR